MKAAVREGGGFPVESYFRPRPAAPTLPLVTTLSDFYEPLRVLLKDNDTQQQENSDAMLAAALRSAWKVGLWPAGYAVSGGGVTPEVPVGKAYAEIIMETALFMTVGDTGAYSFATRALSETDHGERKRDILQYCKQKLYELRDGDAAFSSRQSLIAFFNTVQDAADLASVNVAGPLTFSVDYQGSGLTLTPPPI